MTDKKSTAVEPRAAGTVGALNEFSEFPDTMAGRDQLGLTIPRYFFKGDKGDFVYNLDPTIVKKSLEVVILGGKGSRAYFEHAYDPDRIEPPACRSVDGVFPESGNGPEGAANCAECEFSKWGKDKEKPPCSQCYDLLCVETANNAPFVLSFKSTSLKPLKQYQTLLSVEGRPIWSIVTSIASIEEMYGTREYFVATFAKDRDMTLEEARPYFEMWSKMNNQFSQQAPEFEPEETAIKEDADFPGEQGHAEQPEMY